MQRPINIGWDQRISFVIIEPGCQFTGYDGWRLTNGGWRQKTMPPLPQNIPVSWDLLGTPYDNDISSWRCYCGGKDDQG